MRTNDQSTDKPILNLDTENNHLLKPVIISPLMTIPILSK